MKIDEMVNKRKPLTKYLICAIMIIVTESAVFCILQRTCVGVPIHANVGSFIKGNKVKRNKFKRNCQICGKEIYIIFSRIKTVKFCSKKCQGKWNSENKTGKNNARWKGGKLIKKCLVCNKEIKTCPSINAKTCGRRCAGVRHGKQMIGRPSGMKGRKHKPETIAKYIKIRNTKEWRDKVFTPKRNKKISIIKKLKYGTKNKDKRYLKNLIRKSAEYKQWRKAVFKHDSYTCQKCFKNKVYLEAHHIKSYTSYPKLRFKIDNGITLCKKCHSKETLCVK